jgi:hypothetical protein
LNDASGVLSRDEEGWDVRDVTEAADNCRLRLREGGIVLSL